MNGKQKRQQAAEKVMALRASDSWEAWSSDFKVFDTRVVVSGRLYSFTVHDEEEATFVVDVFNKLFDAMEPNASTRGLGRAVDSEVTKTRVGDAWIVTAREVRSRYSEKNGIKTYSSPADVPHSWGPYANVPYAEWDAYNANSRVSD